MEEAYVDSDNNSSYSYLKGIAHAIADRRLYGWRFFWTSIPLLVFGILIQFAIIYVNNRLALLVYAPILILVILISGLGAKNLGTGFQTIGRGLSFLFLMTSALSSLLPFYIKFDNSLNGYLQFFLIVAVTSIALIVAIVELTILGQRVSLRSSSGLKDDFFADQKKRWQTKLQHR
jgi:hypothetical protein